MYKCCLSTIIAVLFCIGGNAQDEKYNLEEVKHAYEKSTMLLYGSSIEINQESRFIGLFNGALRRELKKSEEAWTWYKVYRQRSWIGAGILIAVVPATVGLAVINPPAAIVAYSIGVVGGIAVLLDTEEFFNRAVWAYNRDMLIQNLEASRIGG